MKEKVTKLLKRMNENYLLEDGTLVIDSHDIFNIIVALENEFEVRIDPMYLKAENFKNIDSLVEMISSLKTK